MIPTFLNSVAAQVRKLVASGKALHVSDKTADELELVAGMFEEPVRYQLPSPSAGNGAAVFDVYLEAEVTPADIAWAWLKLSRAIIPDQQLRTEHDVTVRYDDVKRAAECAELATIAAFGWLDVKVTVDETQKSRVNIQAKERRPVHPYDGTREGARAAWMHIANQLQPELRPIIKADFGCVGQRDTDPDRTEIGNRYRRELEAM